MLNRVILLVGAKPKYLISDQEGQLFSAEMNDWCLPRGITQRFGAIGEHGSIAVLERLIQTMKVECTRLILIPFQRDAMVRELDFFFGCSGPAKLELPWCCLTGQFCFRYDGSL